MSPLLNTLGLTLKLTDVSEHFAENTDDGSFPPVRRYLAALVGRSNTMEVSVLLETDEVHIVDLLERGTITLTLKDEAPER